MKIKLDNTHSLHSDPQCYWVTTTVKSEKTGKDYERIVSGYYANANDCINSYIDRKIRSSEAEDIKQLYKEVEELKKQVKGWKVKLERARGSKDD